MNANKPNSRESKKYYETRELSLSDKDFSTNCLKYCFYYVNFYYSETFIIVIMKLTERSPWEISYFMDHCCCSHSLIGQIIYIYQHYDLWFLLSKIHSCPCLNEQYNFKIQRFKDLYYLAMLYFFPALLRLKIKEEWYLRAAYF